MAKKTIPEYTEGRWPDGEQVQDPNYSKIIGDIASKWDFSNRYRKEISEVTSKFIQPDDKEKTRKEVLELLENLDRNNCCDRLISFFTLLQKHKYQVWWWCRFYKEWQDLYSGFQTSEAVIIGSPDKFNKWEELSPDDIYVNCHGHHDMGTLSLLQIEDGNNPACDDYKDVIIRFIEDNIKYINTN